MNWPGSGRTCTSGGAGPPAAPDGNKGAGGHEPMKPCRAGADLDSPSQEEPRSRGADVLELYAHIGNVIRLAALLDPKEAETACERARQTELPSMLLNPLVAPESPRDTQLNRQLLGAFRRFRLEIAAASSARSARSADRCEDTRRPAEARSRE